MEKEDVKRKLTPEESKAFWENEFKEQTLRPLHDVCKEHPFWRTLSKDFYVEGIDSLRRLLNTFIGHFSKNDIDKCPHAVLIYPILHNVFDSILKTKCMPKYHGGKTIMDTKAFGNFILCMQTALQIVHYYLDDIFDEDSVVSYEPVLVFDKEEDTYSKCTYRTYGARSNGDGTYRSVRIITKDEVPEVLKRCEEIRDGRKGTADYFRNNGNLSYAATLDKEVEFHQEYIDDLKDNKEKHFIIK